MKKFTVCVQTVGRVEPPLLFSCLKMAATLSITAMSPGREFDTLTLTSLQRPPP